MSSGTQAVEGPVGSAVTMDFDLTDSQRLLFETADGFCRKECPPEKVREHVASGVHDEAVWRRFADNGWLGIGVAEELSGSGGDIVDACLVLEATAPGQEVIGQIFATMCFGAHLIASMGTPQMKAELLPRLTSGDARFALSITEPGGGTDVLGAMKTVARSTAGGWVLNGAKMFTSAVDVADYLVVVARTSPAPEGKPAKGVSVFLVDKDAPGVTAQPISVLNGDNTNMMYYTDVEIGADRLIGELDRGFYGILDMLNYERIGTGAVCVGWGRAALEYVLDYAKNREAFGGPIGRFQAVQQNIARMHLLVEQARLLVYRAAWLQAQGRPCGMEATGAKAIAAENAFAACDLGLQVLGGLGYTTECEVNRYWRKSRLYRLAPVSNEMAFNFVAESLGLPKSY